jgi:hypothetical protein
VQPVQRQVFEFQLLISASVTSYFFCHALQYEPSMTGTEKHDPSEFWLGRLDGSVPELQQTHWVVYQDHEEKKLGKD